MTALPEDEFEVALQQYERAVAEYKLALNRYIAAVGPLAAHKKTQEAINRLCLIDVARPMLDVTQVEVEHRATDVVGVVDSWLR